MCHDGNTRLRVEYVPRTPTLISHLWSFRKLQAAKRCPLHSPMQPGQSLSIQPASATQFDTRSDHTTICCCWSRTLLTARDISITRTPTDRLLAYTGNDNIMYMVTRRRCFPAGGALQINPAPFSRWAGTCRRIHHLRQIAVWWIWIKTTWMFIAQNWGEISPERFLSRSAGERVVFRGGRRFNKDDYYIHMCMA